MIRVTLAWLGLVPVMIVNGVARQSLYGPLMSELRAHQVSTVIGVGLLLTYAWFVIPWLGIDSSRRAWTIGAYWVCLTIIFEFGFGHLVAGHPWSRLFRDYNVVEGRVWSLFLVAVVLTPWLVFRLKT